MTTIIDECANRWVQRVAGDLLHDDLTHYDTLVSMATLLMAQGGTRGRQQRERQPGERFRLPVLIQLSTTNFAKQAALRRIPSLARNIWNKETFIL